MKEKIGKNLVVALVLVGILVFSFWYGGNAPGLQGFSLVEQESTEEVSEQSEKEEKRSVAAVEATSTPKSNLTETTEKSLFQQIVMNIKLKKKASNPSQKTQSNKKAQKNASKAVEKEKKKSTTEKKSTTQKEKSQNTDSESDKEENTTEISEDMIQCTVYISCATVLDNMNRLATAKKSLIPKDGLILKETMVLVKKDATVFDVLQKATKENKIHLEYTFTPIYKSYYIEGIYNLYEFDCGNTSGWMYSVNDEFPDIGCSSYAVENGDVIRWLYSCELGKDIGKYYKE